MIESKYNIWIERHGREFLFNGISGAVLSLPSGTKDKIERLIADRADRSSEHTLVQMLRKGAMLVSEDTDELEILRYRYQRGCSDTSRLNLTIITSLGCNFACPYCYEAKQPSIIGANVAEAILGYLATNIGHISQLNVHWLGGEPLLGKRSLLSLSEAFMSMCRAHNVEYLADITTNGYLLDKRTAVELAEHCVTDAQVSIDGPEDIHDAMRPQANGRGSFSKLIANVKSAIDHLNITVRVNVDRSNYQRLEELLAYLSREGLTGRIAIYLGQLVHVNDGVNSPSASYKPTCFVSNDFAQLDSAFMAMAIRYGFNGPALSQPLATPCTAMRLNDLIIGSEGELYKCWKSVGNASEVIGSILNYGHPNDRVTKWLSYDPFSDRECRECIALPVCMGGCAHHAMKKELYASRCSTFRYSYREQLTQFIDTLKSEEPSVQQFNTSGRTWTPIPEPFVESRPIRLIGRRREN